ncbi:MAG: ROK family protein [Verrucomicrobiota bacterium JB025]|nr:ROK family protein [Verrucomicrobiota bacterium JB025]
MKVLVLDVGGSNLKLRVTGHEDRTKIPSGADYSPERMMADLKRATDGWEYDVATVGFPAPVVDNRLATEPWNLGTGWVNFDFEKEIGKPVKLINDAAMQAIGCYDGGRMLFLSLGTGLGSALIDDYKVIGLELSRLRYSSKYSLEDRLGKAGQEVSGRKKWEERFHRTLKMLRMAFVPDYIVVGGGEAKRLRNAEDFRRVDNMAALEGGERLWNDERFKL